jgi:chorismate mutase
MKLFMKRYETVELIGRIKKKAGLPVVDDKREREIMKKIDLLTTDGRVKSGIARIYRAVFSTSYSIEKEE